MSTAGETTPSQLESLSALVDGELGTDDAAAACRCWREDGQARASWHVYHLIGDVLRSDDLAVEPARNVAMLAAIRTRLAAEAVVLAPEPLPASRAAPDVDPGRRLPMQGWRFPWVVSSAVAAGFVAVIGTFAVMRQPQAPATVLAAASQPTAFAASSAASPRIADAAPEVNPARPIAVASAGIVRDPRLDAYLAAHKQFAGSSALGVPSVFLRSATVETNGR